MGTLNAIAPPSVYLDTNVFIYAMEDFANLGAKLKALFARFDRGELHAVTSELTLAEVLIKPLRDGNSVAADAYEKILRSTASLTVVPVKRDTLVKAAGLRATTSLKLPDAIHAATALTFGCATFLTNDMTFAAIDSLPVMLVSKLP